MTTSFLSQLPLLALTFLLFLPAIILHEVSHGYVAYMLGDPTAKMRGRLTLNPISRSATPSRCRSIRTTSGATSAGGCC